MSAVNPTPNETRTGVEQQELTTVIGHRPDLLRQIPWRRTKLATGAYSFPKPGFGETFGFERQALVNDFCKQRIPIQVRLDVDVLRELTRDPEATELVVMGPDDRSWAMPKERLPDQAYTIDGEWRDFNAFFANWLNHEAHERPEFGAEFTVMRKELQIVGGEETVVRVPVTKPARKLFEWRTLADRDSGELPSGLIVPTSVRVNLLEDEDALPADFDATKARVDNSAVTSGTGGRKRG